MYLYGFSYMCWFCCWTVGFGYVPCHYQMAYYIFMLMLIGKLGLSPFAHIVWIYLWKNKRYILATCTYLFPHQDESQIVFLTSLKALFEQEVVLTLWVAVRTHWSSFCATGGIFQACVHILSSVTTNQCEWLHIGYDKNWSERFVWATRIA